MKAFLIIGNLNAVTYKQVFPLIKAGEVRLGVNSAKTFITPSGLAQKFGNIYWYTTLHPDRVNPPLILTKRYSPTAYPKYDNYDAIEVSRTENVPMDYDGVMGVPITFLGKYCPEQFEIVKFRNGNDGKDLAVNGKCPFFRILIRRRRSFS